MVEVRVEVEVEAEIEEGTGLRLETVSPYSMIDSVDVLHAGDNNVDKSDVMVDDAKDIYDGESEENEDDEDDNNDDCEVMAT